MCLYPSPPPCALSKTSITVIFVHNRALRFPINIEERLPRRYCHKVRCPPTPLTLIYCLAIILCYDNTLSLNPFATGHFPNRSRDAKPTTTAWLFFFLSFIIPSQSLLLTARIRSPCISGQILGPSCTHSPFFFYIGRALPLRHMAGQSARKVWGYQVYTTNDNESDRKSPFDTSSYGLHSSPRKQDDG